MSSHFQSSSTVFEPPHNDTQDEPSDGTFVAIKPLKALKPEVALEEGHTAWENDPRNPLNWRLFKKWVCVFVVSLYLFATIIQTSVMAPALPQIKQHFPITDETIVDLSLSIYLLPFAFAPLVFGPLTEMYGRLWVLHGTMVLLLAFNIGCVFAPTTGALIGLRFLSGVMGSVPLPISGAIVSDLFIPAERGTPMAVFSVGGLISPVVGPISGGFLTQSAGFRDVFWLLVGITGLALVVGLPFLSETYGPVLLKRKLHAAQGPSGNPIAMSSLERLDFVWTNLSRPFILLTRSFICFVLSLYLALIYGIYYVMFTTFPTIFAEDYHFTTGTVGLAYLGVGMGFFLATLLVMATGDKTYAELVRRNNSKPTPEMRIPFLILGSFFVPVGLFWYGWSVQSQIHWIMPIIGTGVFGFGLSLGFQSIQLYLIDAFTYAASAVSAAAVFRSLLAFGLPLCGSQMYDALGNGGGNSLLGGIAIVIGIPFPIWIYYRGDRIRSRNPLNT